jgi:hypothetical protein
MEEKIFVAGMIVKRPPDAAPDFIKLNVSFKLAEFVEFAKAHHRDGWLNAQLKVSKAGNMYMELDTFTPTKKEEYDIGLDQVKQAAAAPEFTKASPDNFTNDDIPF